MSHLSFLLILLLLFILPDQSLCESTSSRLITKFPTCNALNTYYISKLLPLIGPFGLNSTNAYSQLRASPSKSRSTRPGGPSGLPLKRPIREPKRVKFSNITDDSLRGIDEDDDLNGPIEGRDFSNTNVQVRGVDEPDIIKTDGNRVFTISGDIFSVVKVLENGASGRRSGKLKLPTYPQDMLIEGDYVLVLGEVFDYARPAYHRYNPRQFKPFGEAATVVYQIYVGGANPKLISTLKLEGNLVRARERKGIARLVMRYNPLNSLYLFYPRGSVTANQTRRWNSEIVRLSRPASWLPTYRLRRKDQFQYGVYSTCSDVFYSPNIFSGYSLLTVVTLPVKGLLNPNSAASIVSDAEIVYSNLQSLYVSTSEFRFNDLDNDDSRWGPDYQTALHKFSLTDEGASYVASGIVSGSVINQFAMHEFEGVFYIATTNGAAWWSSRDLSASKLTAFLPHPGTRKMKKIGEVGNLGVGERIFSVRYIRNTAYVVTFRETDPLYVLDLSKPRRLKILGELKIPGFSSYLHPVSPGKILGVGREANNFGVTSGAKVSLFDVRNKSNPLELSTWTLRGSYSDAEWDHRAFLYWQREGIAVMPVNVVGGEGAFRGSIVLDITDTRIIERGRVVHNVIGLSYVPSIKRNAIIGGINLWSMSTEVLQVNNINELNNTKGQISIRP